VSPPRASPPRESVREGVRDRGRDPGRDGRRDRGVALGYLALLPLLVAYEWGCEGRYRSVAEIVAFLPIARAAEARPFVRVAVLLALGVLAAWQVHRTSPGNTGAGVLPRLWRIVLEGALAALLLGPALLLLLDLFGEHPRPEDLGLAPGRPALALRTAAFLAGGAAWEEIVFRIGVQSLVFLIAARSISFLTEDPRIARAGAEILAIGASAAVFAAAHLAVFTQVLGPGGAAFDPVVFTWRLAAGILLAVLFRWRGPGVAAWAHALFDFYLALGGGSEVFL